MTYEITEGHPMNGVCRIVAYDGEGTYVWYNGYFNAKRGMWTLYPRSQDVPGQYRKKITLSEWDVHMAPRKSKPAASVKEQAAAAKPKPWWTLPDPPGQIEIL